MKTEPKHEKVPNGGHIGRNVRALCGDIVKIVAHSEKIIESSSTERLDTLSETCGSYGLGITALSTLKNVLDAFEQGGVDVSDGQQAVNSALGSLHSKSDALGCG